MRALFVLTPTESKRLIGKAVAEMQEVKYAKENDYLLIGHGSTNVYVAEEVLGKEKLTEVMNRDAYLSGFTKCGVLCTTPGKEKPPVLVLKNGVVHPPADTMSELLREFGKNSVVVKGANAVDPEGNAAAFMAHPEGGTIGWAIGTVVARGIHLITPVGLEKLIPSVEDAVPMCGQRTFDYCQGLRVGLMPLSGATVVTEIQALHILTGVEVCHVGSGGSGNSQGAVVLVAEGETPSVEKAIQLIESIKGEPPLEPMRQFCEQCMIASPTQPKDYKTEGLPPICMYQGKNTEELPPHLKTR